MQEGATRRGDARHSLQSMGPSKVLASNLHHQRSLVALQVLWLAQWQLAPLAPGLQALAVLVLAPQFPRALLLLEVERVLLHSRGAQQVVVAS